MVKFDGASSIRLSDMGAKFSLSKPFFNRYPFTRRRLLSYARKRAQNPTEWRWIILAVSLKKRLASLTISCSGYISHIPVYQMLKFDCAGVLVSTISESVGFSECLLFRRYGFARYTFLRFLTTYRLRLPI